jgi:hypothetical protein
MRRMQIVGVSSTDGSAGDLCLLECAQETSQKFQLHQMSEISLE